ncbi:MG284/MPN403 family protein [Mycoplasmopsis edwardii]|nr:hypothetical protein [Mycoplasmopsis edwardii]
MSEFEMKMFELEIEGNKDFYAKVLKFIEDLFANYLSFQKVYKQYLLKMKLEERFFPDDKEIKEVRKILERRLNSKTHLITMILKSLSPESSWIIENCYLNENTRDYTEWYLKHFSKTTFYKKKRIAILEFANYYFGLF